MHHHFQPRRLHHLIKGAFLCNVRNDNNLQVVGLVLVRIANLVRLVLGPDGCDHCVALLEELIEAVGCGERRQEWQVSVIAV